ncbi:MAG: MFS transporter [Lachnospiraceae bacterium]|nr:MFS transporter [Lachnospiraceae bacterium]
MKKYSAYCIILTAVFYIVQVSVLGYTVYFFSEKGYSAGEISVLMAISGVIAGIVQPLLGYIADKYERIDFKNILSVSGVIVTLLFLNLLYFDNNKIATGILFAIIFASTNSMSPFVNSSCFYYKDRGINVNYGIARGFGSFAFAVGSYILGGFTKIFGAKAVSINGIVFTIIFFIIISIMPRVKNKKERSEIKVDVKKHLEGSSKNIVAKYPSFFLIMLATILTICFQNADCGYLIQMIEELGGDSFNLGIANAIGALVEIPIMFYMAKLMKKIKLSKLILLATIFYVVRGFVFTIPSITAIYLAQLLQMFTYAIIIPATVYLSDEMMQEEDKNKGQSLVGLAVTLGFILGSFAGGQFISIGGTMLLKMGCIVIAILGFICALLGNIIYKIYRR